MTQVDRVVDTQTEEIAGGVAGKHSRQELPEIRLHWISSRELSSSGITQSPVFMQSASFLQGRLPTPGQEHGTVAQAVCGEQSVNGTVQALEDAGKNASETRPWAWMRLKGVTNRPSIGVNRPIRAWPFHVATFMRSTSFVERVLNIALSA